MPPQPSANGLDAGKVDVRLAVADAVGRAVVARGAADRDAHAAAAWNAWSNCVIACAVQFDSAAPQLIEITDGLLTLSCTAVVIASRKPWFVFGAK